MDFRQVGLPCGVEINSKPTRRSIMATRWVGSVVLAAGVAACSGNPDGASEAEIGSVMAPLDTEFSIGPAGHSLSYFQCATEGQNCVLDDTFSRYVAYGANGNFVYANKSGVFACNNATFGTDPAPNIAKACYFSVYGEPLPESDQVVTAPPGSIAYGADGAFNFITLAGTPGEFSPFSCNNATFGDPAPGKPKACYFVPYIKQVDEGGSFVNNSFTPLIYGANGKFVYVASSGTVSCSNATFGDPIPGVPKACYVASNLHYLADEGQPLNANVAGTVVYSSSKNGNFTRASISGGGICNNATFGDPDFGVAKRCYQFIRPPR
jgi:hypothetical protein